MRKKRTQTLTVQNFMKTALRALGGKAHQEEVFIWLAKNYGEDFMRKEIGKFDWMYPFRWTQSTYRRMGVMVPWEQSGKGMWELEWTHKG
tara:strand:- start:752 stop:1021 length:270 start_codon:yes stop_codon:yes gene_type:complete